MLQREHYSFQVVLYLNNFSNHWTIKIPSLPIKAFNPIKKQTSLGAIIIPIASVSQLTEFTNHLSILSGPCLFCKNLFIYFFLHKLQLIIIQSKISPPLPGLPLIFLCVSHPTPSQKQVHSCVSGPRKVQGEKSVCYVYRYIYRYICIKIHLRMSLDWGYLIVNYIV